MIRTASAAVASAIDIRPSAGIGQAAVLISQLVASSKPGASPSMEGLPAAIKEELLSVMAECSEDNWDGYGAVAVNLETYQAALAFLDLLPSYIPPPDVSVDPDGDFVFEWYATPARLLALSVAAGGTINFAAVYGDSTVRGTERLEGFMPRFLLDLIHRVFNEVG